ncbi:Lrp/AsnC family transcriptional regulator [Humibacillus sp. DSM 29435]|uniref:Lrp/AsnC family transcriptional regulator n=1 Tax=Humibacillus sp. DSM 29435 TaxID=1869167 RepID=UPI000AC43FCE|nr:AsnC family transcriptional regulator [Humibacillus sp. DSM 29435]
MTQESAIVADEVDLAIVNCLQLQPRASWTVLAEALDIDPVTVARRWQRLSSTGIAWVTGRATGQGTPESCLAVVELSCSATETLAIAERVTELPHVLSVEHTSGPRSLTLLVEVRDLAFLSQFLLDSVGSIPGVVATSSYAVTKVYSMGDHWQLHVLDAAQQAVMMRAPQARLDGLTSAQAPLSRPYDLIDRQMILLLGEDGRMPVATIAARARLSESTVRRRLTDLVSNGRVVLRCDIALPDSGWPVISWLWAQADAHDIDAVATRLRQISGIRVCWRISGGPANLMLALTTHSLHELSLVEARLATEVPQMRILDRSMVLRSIKRMGRQLDLSGRSIRSVPLDIWADPASHQHP